MNIGIHTITLSPEYQGKKPTALPAIRTYIAALLMMTPNINVQSKNTSTYGQEEYASSYQEKKIDAETAEYLPSHEIIFKNGMKKTLDKVNDLSEIPIGGKIIEYFRDGGGDTGNKLSAESIKILNLPDKIDFVPRNIISSVSSMIVCLGNRKFEITPDLGKIQDVYMTAEELVIETNLFFDITYDKEEKLPDLLFRLWRSPVGKGEKKGFWAATVKEV